MHAALLDVMSERPHERERHLEAGADWQRRARDAFLDGYDAVARVAGLASPRAEANGLLELFMLEKAVYELGYEADNRPDWLRIPLRGIVEILGHGHGG
jgi:maltose alpha-D-glucosyltransferase/alpha-amylase